MIDSHLLQPFADLSDKDLRGVDLSGMDLSGANLQRTNLTLANLQCTTVKYPAYGYIDEASSFISQCLVGESPERDFVTKDDLGLTCLPQVLLTRVALTGVIPRDITLAAALLPKAV